MKENSDILTLDEFARRQQQFERQMDQLAQSSVRTPPPADGELFRCPCCRAKTIWRRGNDEICPVCFWQDDGQHDHDADVIRGGPNGAESLTQGRASFAEFGASQKRFVQYVRLPLPEEV